MAWNEVVGYEVTSLALVSGEAMVLRASDGAPMELYLGWLAYEDVRDLKWRVKRQVEMR